MRTLRLVWEFRGNDAKAIADHHLIHLNEFLAREKYEVAATGVEVHSEMFCTAYIVCSEEIALKLRDPLKPQAAYLEE